jgi:hypothetical protein
VDVKILADFGPDELVKFWEKAAPKKMNFTTRAAGGTGKHRH